MATTIFIEARSQKPEARMDGSFAYFQFLESYWSFGIPFKNQGSVGAAEAERVGKGVFDLHGAGDVGDVVQVAIGIGILVIDGRGRDLVADGHHGDAGFETTGAAEEVA